MSSKVGLISDEEYTWINCGVNEGPSLYLSSNKPIFSSLCLENKDSGQRTKKRKVTQISVKSPTAKRTKKNERRRVKRIGSKDGLHDDVEGMDRWSFLPSLRNSQEFYDL